jgi:hypothetical protein
MPNGRKQTVAEFQPPIPGHLDETPGSGEPVAQAPEQHRSGGIRAAIAVVVTVVCLALVPLGLLVRTMQDMPSPVYPSAVPATINLAPGNYVIVAEIRSDTGEVSDDDWPATGCAIIGADGTPVEIIARRNVLPAPILNGSSGQYVFERVVGSFTLKEANPRVSCAVSYGQDGVRIHTTMAWYATLGLDVLGFLVALAGVFGIFAAGVYAVKPGKFHGLIIKLVGIPVGLAVIALIGTLVLRWLAR